MYNKEVNKIRKSYKKVLRESLDMQLGSQSGFMLYLLTYLSYIRDNRILLNDLRVNDDGTKFEDKALPLDNKTEELIKAINEYALYETALKKYKTLSEMYKVSKPEEIESNPLLVAATKTCYTHWQNF